MLVNSDAESNQTEGVEERCLTLAETHLMKVFRLLSEEHRYDILRFIDVLLNAQ